MTELETVKEIHRIVGVMELLTRTVFGEKESGNAGLLKRVSDMETFMERATRIENMVRGGLILLGVLGVTNIAAFIAVAVRLGGLGP